MSTGKPSILLISSEFPPNTGGIGNHAFNLAKSLSDQGFQVTVLADIIDIAESELLDFEAKLNFKVAWIRRKSFVIQTYLERIVKAIQLAGKAEKVICSGKFSLWLAIAIKIFYPRKELLAVVHGSELDLKSWLPKKLTTYSLGKFDKIIAVSKYTRQFLPQYLPSTIQIFVIPNGINCSEFELQKSTVLTGKPSLVTVGSVTERKGQENIINALPDILRVYPGIEYHVIGKPVLQSKLEKKANNLEVGKLVHFHGAVSRKELLQKLSSATIKLMLSNHTADGDFEGFGIAVLEANAFGVPVIGSINSGISDAVDNNKTGILVNPHNPGEISKAIETILNNYSCFSTQAKLWAIQHDWKNIVKEYEAVLNS